MDNKLYNHIPINKSLLMVKFTKKFNKTKEMIIDITEHITEHKLNKYSIKFFFDFNKCNKLCQ